MTRRYNNHKVRINNDSSRKRLLLQVPSLHQPTYPREGVKWNKDEALSEGLPTAPRTKNLFFLQLLPGSWGTLCPPFKTPVARLVLLEKTDKPTAVQSFITRSCLLISEIE